jgi:hypothetical protein
MKHTIIQEFTTVKALYYWIIIVIALREKKSYLEGPPDYPQSGI